MINKNIVINPSFSGFSLALDFPLLPDHANLVKKITQKLEVARSSFGFKYSL